jgi:hypothetical protein
VPAIENPETDALRLVAEAVARANWLTPAADGSIAAGGSARSSNSLSTPRCASMNLLCTPAISTCRR